MTRNRNQTVSAEKLMPALGIVHVNRDLADKWDQREKHFKGRPLSL